MQKPPRKTKGKGQSFGVFKFSARRRYPGGPVKTADFLASLAEDDVATFSAHHPYAFLLRRYEEGVLSLGSVPELTFDDDIYLVRHLSKRSLWHSVCVGRSEDNDIRIKENSISRHHAIFERNPNTGDYLLVDRGSRNATRVNGHRLSSGQPCVLSSKAVIEFGGLAFSFLSAKDMFNLLRKNWSPRQAKKLHLS